MGILWSMSVVLRTAVSSVVSFLVDLSTKRVAE